MTHTELKQWQNKYIKPLVSDAKKVHSKKFKTEKNSFATRKQQLITLKFFKYIHSNAKKTIAKRIVKQVWSKSGIHLTKFAPKYFGNRTFGGADVGMFSDIYTEIKQWHELEFVMFSHVYGPFQQYDYSHLILQINKRINDYLK